MTLYRARVWALGEGPPQAPDIVLTLDHLAGLPLIGGQRIRPGDGSILSAPYTLHALDVDDIITERWGDAETARPNMLGRLVSYERSDDGETWGVLDVGRVSGFGEASGPGQYRIEVSDETWAGRAASLFERGRSVQLYPFGPTEPWGPPGGTRVDAAGLGSFAVSAIDGDAVQLSPQQPPENVPPAMCAALREDLAHPMRRTADQANGNFASLRCQVTAVEGQPSPATLRVIAFGGSSLGASASVRNVLGGLDPELGDDHRRLPPVWVHWPGHGFTSPDLQEVTARLDFPAGPGLPVSEDLPYYVGGTTGVHLGELWASVLRGEHGGEPLRVSEASLAALETADLPRVWLRQTEPAADRMAWLAGPGGMGVFLHQIAPDPTDGLRVLDLRSPDADDIDGDVDTLPILDSSTVRGHTWESSGREVVTRLAVQWRRAYRDREQGPSIDGLVTSSIPIERTHDSAPYVGDHARRYQLDLIVSGVGGASDPGHLTTVLAADFFGMLGDGALLRRLQASAITLDLEVGQLVRLDATDLAAPNPVTRDRTGHRLCRVLELAEGPAHYEVTLLDLGAALQPLPPVTVSITQDATDRDLVTVTVGGLGPDTLAEIEVAHTTSASEPDDDEWEIRDADLEAGPHTYSLRRSGGFFHARARATQAGRVRGPWAYASTAGAVRALILDAAAALDGPAPTIAGAANAAAQGVRVRYAVHDDGAEPPALLPESADYPAAQLATGLALPATVAPGQRLTAEVEGWTGYSGGSVTGQPGPAVLVTVARPVEPLDAERPTAAIELHSETTDAETLRFLGALGQGGRAPLAYQYAVEGVTGWTAWAPMPGGEVITDGQAGRPSPIARSERTRTVLLRVRDADGRVSQVASYALSSEPPEITAADLLTLSTRWRQGPSALTLDLVVEYGEDWESLRVQYSYASVPGGPPDTPVDYTIDLLPGSGRLVHQVEDEAGLIRFWSALDSAPTITISAYRQSGGQGPAGRTRTLSPEAPGETGEVGGRIGSIDAPAVAYQGDRVLYGVAFSVTQDPVSGRPLVELDGIEPPSTAGRFLRSDGSQWRESQWGLPAGPPPGARFLRHSGSPGATATWAAITWGEIDDRPSTFPPSSHSLSSHTGSLPWARLDDVPEQAERWPAWIEITGVPAAFPPSPHTHPLAEISDFPAGSTAGRFLRATGSGWAASQWGLPSGPPPGSRFLRHAGGPGGTAEWAQIAYGDIEGTIPLAPHGLAAHSDVSSTTPTAGQVLRYTGSQWAPWHLEVSLSDLDAPGAGIVYAPSAGGLSQIPPATGLLRHASGGYDYTTDLRAYELVVRGTSLPASGVVNGGIFFNTNTSKLSVRHSGAWHEVVAAPTNEPLIVSGDGIEISPAGYDGTQLTTITLDIGSGPGQVARGDHDHDGRYLRLATGGTVEGFTRVNRIGQNLSDSTQGFTVAINNVNRWHVAATGTHVWRDPSTGDPDTYLRRQGAGHLRTDGQFSADGAIRAPRFIKIGPIGTWSALTPEDVPDTLEVSDAIATGVLTPRPEWDVPGPPPDRDAWTREMYEEYIQHDDMSGSGIDPDELMSRAEMEQYAWAPVLMPQNFTASHHLPTCPAYRIDLSWSNAGRIEAKRLEWSADGATWHVLDDQIPASATSYTHEGGPTPPVEGMNRYRIRFVSESQWAQAQIVALCPI